MASVTVEELDWAEQPLGEIEFPKERLNLAAGFGSGLATRPGAPSAGVWAIADRGPNLEVKTAVDEYGWVAPESCSDQPDAKVMPRLEFGPYLARLRITDGEVELDAVVRLVDRERRPIPGCPVPDGDHVQCEPAYGFEGEPIPPDPHGMDTEGVTALSDGSFWLGEEYGPSLVRIGAGGEVLERLVPEGVVLADAGYPVKTALPAIAAQRHLNRGFEAIAVTPSEESLYLAFQSPLAHPDEEAHRTARHVRLWRLDRSGRVAAQYLYRLDDPDSFARDNARKTIDRSDLKVCELVALGERQLLVLERGSETSKIYRLAVDDRLALPAEHLQIDTRPTVEQLSRAGSPLPELAKEPLFTSDDWPQVGADIEGMALLAADTLLLVSDNDFGCEGKQTRFYRLRFTEPLIDERG